MAAGAAADAGREQRNRAIGTLIWKDPARILETASRLQDTGASLECRLRGASMGAAIPMGSRVRIELRAGAGLRVGDIVAFVQDTGVCVHRIVYRGRRAGREDLFITQGDACVNPDPPLDADRVLGRVVAYGDGTHWTPTADPVTADRARSAMGRILLRLVAGLMEADVRLGRGVARALRWRREGPARAEPES